MFSFLCFILFGIVLANSNSYKASGSKTLKSSESMQVVVEVGDSSDEIILTLTGPSTVYYAVGFGSYKMKDTYAIIVNGNDDDNVWEQKMGTDTAGNSLQSTFVVKSNTVSDDVRTVILYRSLSTSVDSDYYSFSSSDKSIEVCWAYGTSTAYAYHGEQNYGATKLSLTVSEETFASDLLQAGWIQRFGKNLTYWYGSSPVSVVIVMIAFVFLLAFAVWKNCCSTGNTRKDWNQFVKINDDCAPLMDDNINYEKYVAV